MGFDPGQFRRALGSFVTGVTIVTTRDADGHDVGLTANSFNSVSLDPPMVLWSLARSAGSKEAFVNANSFAVHILSVAQEDLSNRFARKGEDKFAGLRIERGIDDVPLLPDCTARFVCRTAYQYDGGDHIIFVGEVLGFEQGESRPLAFHAGRYAMTAEHLAEPTGQENEVDGSFSRDFLGYLLGRAYYQFYAGLDPALARAGLSDGEHYVLSVLGNRDGLTLAEVDAAISFTRKRVTAELIDQLISRGLLIRTAGDARLWLTADGRRLMIELTAAAKSVEVDAQSLMTDGDFRLLKRGLRQLVDCTRLSEVGVGAR